MVFIVTTFQSYAQQTNHYKGNTETSLGYHTIKFTPYKGRKLRIQLTAANANLNSNVGLEVAGLKLDDGVARNTSNTSGTLNIIEAEIYEDR